MKIVSYDEATKRIQNKWPNQDFELLNYTRVSKPIDILCKKCGKITHYSSYNNFMSTKRLGVCSCYNENNNLTKHYTNLEQAKTYCITHNIQYYRIFQEEKDKKYYIELQCPTCKQIYKKPITVFLKNASCYYCENRHNLNTQGFASTLSSEYTLLSEYKGLDEKVLVKHSCGFVWSVVPRKLYNYRGCPKCNKKRSQGERRITQYLDEKQLDYNIEYRFPWQTNPLRRYDFFLPDYNLIIEYNGEQHYKETHFFETDLATQEQIDVEKYNDAIHNGLNYLVIPYTSYNNIENILDSWFNDYSYGKYTQVSGNNSHESEDIV